MSTFDKIMVVTRFRSTRKGRRFTPAEVCCVVFGVWAVAGESPLRGCLLIHDGIAATLDDIAQNAGVPKRVARDAVAKMRRLGMLYHDDDLGCDVVHDWDEVNPPPKSDTTAAERQRRYRAKLKAQRDKDRDVTSRSRVTGRNGHAEITPTEVEVEGEVTNSPVELALDDARTRLKGRALSEAVDTVFVAWQEASGHKAAVLDAKRRTAIVRALTGDAKLPAFPLEDVVDAVRGWKHSPHHRGQNDRDTVYDAIPLLLRDADQIETFRDLQRGTAKTVVPSGADIAAAMNARGVA